MRVAYQALHALGHAHSFEAYRDGSLVGGLYGIAIGRVFFGESMFARESDASKVAFWHAVRFLAGRGVELIDCQLPSAHLSRLGATSLPRREFLQRLRTLTGADSSRGPWTAEFAARKAELCL